MGGCSLYPAHIYKFLPAESPNSVPSGLRLISHGDCCLIEFKNHGLKSSLTYPLGMLTSHGTQMNPESLLVLFTVVQ